MIASRPLAAASILWCNKAPPRPLITLSTPRSSSSTVERETDLPILGEGGERDTGRSGLRGRVLGGGNAEENAGRCRRASASIANAAVAPVPRLTTVAFSTSSTAARLNASQSAASAGPAALIVDPSAHRPSTPSHSEPDQARRQRCWPTRS